jgi:hypothetical protein
MSVPYTFATATGSLPLSQLDSNFSTAITIGNTAVVLGDTITTINNLTLANVAITSVSTAFPNGYLANSNVIVGTTTLTLGSTVTSINGLSLSNVTISSGNVTISNVTTTNVTATTANVTTANVGTLTVIGNATIGGNATVTGNVSMNIATITTANVTTANTSSLVVTGNQTFVGTGNRITGDFTNATVASRVAFQTSTSNNNTGLVVLPNGTATTSNIQFFNNSDSTNASSLQIANLSTESTIRSLITGTGTYLPMTFYTGGSEKMRIDSSGNVQVQAGAVMPYAPAPAAVSAATTLTNANIQGQIISATGTTYTITMPLGTTMETLATWATTNIAYDFFVINTATGVITMAVNTGVTSLGSLTIAIGASAHFRLRRTAANTFVMYRLV